MNTLNNIHALVDMDAGKAKRTIVELSKLMRYVLYEASNRTILLSREIQFLDNYIALMKLRYTGRVRIECCMPDEVPEVQIPPLLFISFVENAFKHGVSRLSGFLCLSRMADLPFVVRTAITGDLWNNTTASGWRISASG